MTATFVITPEPAKRGIGITHGEPMSARPVPASQLVDQAIHADIAELAYLVWQEEGCPSGSAESNWLEAERRIQENIKHRPIEL